MTVAGVHVGPADAPVAVFRSGRGIRLLFAAIISICAGFAFWFCIVYPWISHDTPGASVRLIFNGLGLVLLGILAYAWRSGSRYRIEVFQDRIVETGALRTREMRLDAIAGMRIQEGRNARVLVLVPKEPGAKRWKIHFFLSGSSEFEGWARGNFPDLDAQDSEAQVQAILHDESLGSDPEERGQRLRQVTLISRALNGAASIAIAWGFIYPRPYSLVVWVLLCLPFAALAAAAAFPGLMRLEERKTGAYPNLAPTVLGPSIILALRAFLDREVLAWDHFWLPFAIITTLLSLSLILRFPEMRSQPRLVLPLFLFTALYGYAATVSFNCMQDGSVPSDFRVQVRDKRIATGRHTSYYLTLSSWGALPGDREVSVTRGIFDLAGVHDSVTVRQRRGALGIPWFFLKAP